MLSNHFHYLFSQVQIYDYNDDGDHDYIGEFYTNLEEMAEGEGFQIVTWDVINEKKKSKKDYENSGTVILKSIKIDQVWYRVFHLKNYKIKRL